MSGSILVLNAGSSSLKFALYRRDMGLQLDVKGAASQLASRQPRFHARSAAHTLKDEHLNGPLSAISAANHVLDWLASEGLLATVEAVGHRIVHGGPIFSAPALLDPGTLETLNGLVPLAPLHQPYNIEIVTLSAARFPGVPQIGCFDTAFHATCPRLATLYGLPRALSDEGIVAYGFHGLSYSYIADVLRAQDGDRAGGRTIVAHLGNGASMCGMDRGRSVATTMGFSALDGLLMGSRCGSLDPGVVLHLMQARGMAAEAVTTLLYEQSGLLGVSGISGDMGTLLQSDTPAAKQAIDLFVYRAARAIGSLTAALNGLDTLVFTAGIGQNAPGIRARIGTACQWLGVEIDDTFNKEDRPVISTDHSEVTVHVIPTDEERAVASAAVEHLGIAGGRG